MSIKSGLFNAFTSLNAKFIEEAGYYIPDSVYPKEEEYKIIRESIGIIDHSSDLKLKLSGDGVIQLLEKLLPKDIDPIPYGKGINTMMFDNDANILGVVWLFREDEQFYLFANNTSRSAITQWINKNNDNNTLIEDLTDEFDLISLIGPDALNFLTNFIGEDVIALSYLGMESNELDGILYKLIRVGYTGEFEYKLMIERDLSAQYLQKILTAANDYNFIAKLCGNAILDTLILEMKSINQKKDLVSNSNPLEFGLHWMISFQKDFDFFGKEKLEKLKNTRLEQKALVLTIDGLKDIQELDEKPKLYFENQEVGIAFHVEYSYKLEQFIAYCSIDHELAWPTIPFVIKTKKGQELKAQSQLAPLFITHTVLKASEK